MMHRSSGNYTSRADGQMYILTMNICPFSTASVVSCQRIYQHNYKFYTAILSQRMYWSAIIELLCSVVFLGISRGDVYCLLLQMYDFCVRVTCYYRLSCFASGANLCVVCC